MVNINSGGARWSAPKQPRIRSSLGRGLLRLLHLFVLLNAVAVTASAQTMHFRLGALEMALNGQSWRVEHHEPFSLRLVPVGELAKHARPVFVMQTPIDDLDACETLARAQLVQSLYDEPKVRTIDVGSVQAVEARAHTKCRNLTPAGAAICIPYRGSAYLLVDRIVGCRSAGLMLRSTGDWLDQLVRSLRFSP